jgi:lysozyme family protein
VSPYFLAAFALVVGEEGGYVNDPQDPGGETKYGISKRSYPNLDIAGLTLEQAQGIYYSDYWGALGLDTKPWNQALLLFDAGVNQGVGFAKTLPPDAIGICVARALRYAGNPNLTRYGRGWFTRLFTMFQKASASPNA